jgi:hypothetical protein
MIISIATAKGAENEHFAIGTNQIEEGERTRTVRAEEPQMSDDLRKSSEAIDLCDHDDREDDDDEKKSSFWREIESLVGYG